MEAILSPLRSEALLLNSEQQTWAFVSSDRDSADVSADFAARWLRDSPDAEPSEVATADDLSALLLLRTAQERVFSLFLPLFDETLSDELRMAIAFEIEASITANDRHIEVAWNRFHSTPFPSPQRLASALMIAGQVATPLVAARLRILTRRQPLITEIADAWAQIPSAQFSAAFPQESARSQLIVSGSFTRFVEHLANGIPVGVFHMSEQARIETASLPNGPSILRAWTQPVYQADENFKKDRYEQEAWMEEINQWKATILDLARRRPGGAYATAGRLRELQLRHGRPVHAAKTLCSLAAELKGMGLTALQHRFAALAVKTNPHDVQCHTQLADALKSSGKFVDALRLYESVEVEFFDNAVAKCGKAEVLRDLNKLPEALACYEDTLKAHPDDAFAKCGKAEVLRDLNKLPEALACYEDTIKAHPDDAFAKCGKAEVLRDLNQLNAALTCYDDTIKAHPDNAVAKNGKAEVMRDLNQLPEALACYEDTLKTHPDNAFAKNGKAEVLRDLNKLPEALVCYEDTIKAHPNDAVAKTGRANILALMKRFNEALADLPTVPVSAQDWIGYHMRGMILLKLGQREEAYELFEQGLRASLPRHIMKYFRAAAALRFLRAGDGKQALQMLPDAPQGHLRYLVPLLRAHAFGLIGQEQACTLTATPLLTRGLPVLRAAAQEIQDRYVRHAPRQNLDWLLEREEELALAA